ncbi:hypothetical protein GALMADRAFT_145485 [Galerina marginata CBS 339.88]|uniref:Uncharacterized protein n=1 Tax=Galerina marginata (strain CBS 339.88) TaxID=685588 RepID=A0A067SEW2_GALM3|nr:hypothetical protein GALMADRAFT_145485 [Galerina marginata CBS 339.88]
MPSYNDQPPAFNDPSAADEIYKLIKDAIEVKTLLAEAVAAVRKVDSVAGTQFSKGLDAVDKKYVDLMNESRSSATTLNGVIQDFVDVIVPYSQMTEIALAKRVNKIKLETKKTEAVAKKDLAPYDAKLAKLKAELNALVANLNKTSKKAKTESEAALKAIETEVENITAKINAQETEAVNSESDELGSKVTSVVEKFTGGSRAKTVTHANGQPAGQTTSIVDSAIGSLTGLLGGFMIGGPAGGLFSVVSKITAIGDFFSKPVTGKNRQGEIDAKVKELESAKKEAREKVEEIEAAIQEATVLADSFSGLDGRLGHFDVVWNKVLADSHALGEYIEGQTFDEQEIIQRVNAEAEVYEGLRRALDDYALRVTI